MIPTETAYEQLNSLTLEQSRHVRFHNLQGCLDAESRIRELIHEIFGQMSDACYALHLFDFVHYLAQFEELSRAKNCLAQARELFLHACGDCAYLHFMESFLRADLDFRLEEYYSCLEYCKTANDLWYAPDGTYARPPFLPEAPNTQAAVDRIGFQNLLLMANAYGQLNSPAQGMELLEEFLRVYQPAEASDELLISAEITLAQLYVRAGEPAKAMPFYQKYKRSDYAAYPDLACALSTLSVCLESPADAPIALPVPCCSQDALIRIQYNHGLTLIAQGKETEALELFEQLGEKGLSMAIVLLTHLDRLSEIPEKKKAMDPYCYRQLQNLCLHYEEQMAYRQMAGLQYHIDLLLGAYCKCVTEGFLPAEEGYSFLLNTKYISLETGRRFQLYRNDPPYKEHAPYTAGQVMSLLADSMLLEFVQYRNLNELQYGVFCVSGRSVEYRPIGPARDLEPLIRDWLKACKESALADGDFADEALLTLTKTDTALRRMLFFPIRELLGTCRKLYIAPAGELLSFPFGRLSVSAGACLQDQYLISCLNTGKELLAVSFAKNTTAPALHPSNPLVMGNPVCNAFPPLPHAGQEAVLAADYLGCRPYIGKEATLEQFRAFASPDLLHIASHGVFYQPEAKNNSDCPDWRDLYRSMTESGILFADDELLSCAALSTYDLSDTALAVLTCCHSGESAHTSMDGAYGLRRSFLLAGCRMLLVSLWQVDDRVSLLLTDAFYAALTDGATPAEALRHAINAIRTHEENGIRPYEAPWYWAGYLLIGADPHTSER